MSKTVIVKEAHHIGCTAVKCVLEGTWYSPWYLPNEPTFYGDAAGGKRSNTTHWTIFRCNATDCKAWGLIKQLAIEDYIHDQVMKS